MFQNLNKDEVIHEEIKNTKRIRFKDIFQEKNII